MYCEKCGRKLEPGQVCPCKKKYRKPKWNKKAIMSLLFLALGAAATICLLLYGERLLELLTWKPVQYIKRYVVYAIPAILFAAGILLGCLSLKKGRRNIFARFVIVGNVCGIAAVAGLAGWIVFQDWRLERLLSGTITESGRTKIMDQYNSAGDGSAARERIQKILTKELAEIGKAYNKEEISYDEAAKRCRGITSLSIVDEEAEQKEQEIERLKESKESFEKAEQYEDSSDTVVEASVLYASVIPEDQNYKKARKKYKELNEQFLELAGESNYTENAEILSAFYQIADGTVRAEMDQSSYEQGEKIAKDYMEDKLTGEAAMEKLSILQQVVGEQEELEAMEEQIGRLQASEESFAKAQEMEQDENTLLEAVKSYQEVAEDDPNYEKAQEKAAELLTQVEEECIQSAESLIESLDYSAAVLKLEEGLSLLPENESLLSLKEQYTEEYAEYAVQEADRLIGEEQLDEARTVLNTAYQITNDAAVYEKLEKIRSSGPVSLCELISIDSHGVETAEEDVEDSYGNMHADALLLDAHGGSRALYQLNGQYKSFSGELVSSDASASDSVMNFAIFADDILVYSVTGYTRQTGAQQIAVDLSGVQRLEIQTRQTEGYNNGTLALVNTALQVNLENSKPGDAYERLKDNVVIDAGNSEVEDILFADAYGNLHNGCLEFDAHRDAYMLFNLDGKYANFSGKIVTGEWTHSESSITVQIYLDDTLIFERMGINKLVSEIPFSLDVQNGRVLKIRMDDSAELYESSWCYIADDKLYFEQPDDLSVDGMDASNAGSAGQDREEGDAVTILNGGSERSGGEEASGTAIGDVVTVQNAPASFDIGSPIAAPMTFNGHQYAMYDMNDLGVDSYTALKEYCEGLGGHLAVINYAEENQAIYEYLLNNGKTMAFFGYSDENSEGSWEWAVDQGNSYTNWADGQPNNGANNENGREEHYAHFMENKDGAWNDAPFKSNTSVFICEWEFAQAGDGSFYLDGTVVPQNAYILPDVGQRDLTEADVKRLTHRGIRFAINEIYARNGYTFQLQDTASYFGSQSWYDGGDTFDMDAVVSRMNEYERRNNEYLAQMEIELYGSQYSLN